MRPTNRRILDAAMQLIVKNGYRATTTKEIAEKANVSEATIFRNFKNKQGLMKALISQHSRSMSSIIGKTTGDPHNDLLHIGTCLLAELERKKDIFHISFREPAMFEEVINHVTQYPQAMKHLLMDYFKELGEKGIIHKGNEEANADVFMSIIFGYFIHRLQLGQRVITLPQDKMIKHSTNIFIEGILAR
ncbi:TetR/AcrR family transcriptional regulator [Bacillus atrophaeus]|uniref:TetR/AcrR family transcriptional regulator n=1 Tax=Bacillus atrophaeus TaxID=1452 RepID=UPI00227F59F4|nr:TetR/AcrR family transcriptional regulator [Bacillus atrophaeus]MCY8506912.1 TetR/AcrR family transcriptional regulator [Bacillus atrophaeus]MCY8948694.1 TetR/AcrR family transcriptional regulator [Bacillus atrophaeus]MCY8967111.1 TetR/AcrR family transcriptional regulator [Bacillus atrophaeus]